MPINSLPDGTYRIRQAGAKSEVANLVSNGKKCHYVQIGGDLTKVDSYEDALEFVAGKGLIADPMSMDFGVKPEPEEAPEEEPADEVADEEAADETGDAATA